MSRTKSTTGELALIESIRRSFPRTGRGVTLGIGDDCAILRPRAGEEILVTTDFSLEDRHFVRQLHPPKSVGHRCLARGLSDLAAMGARPLAAFLSLALPPAMAKSKRGQRWIEGFLAGLLDLAELAGVPLAGGDTSSSPFDLVLADIVLVGSAPRGRALRRSGARPGDAIYVTGSLGGAHAELTALLSGKRRSLATGRGDHPHFFPQPRLAVGNTLLRRRLANAAIDISDGLSTDLMHLCESSGLHAEVEAARLPLHSLAQKISQAEGMRAALHGGEDYELLFTASETARVPRTLAGVPITRIGAMRRRRAGHPQMTLVEPDGARRELKPQGWQHLT